MKSFKSFLLEMPLPKDVESTALNPKSGAYSKAKPERELSTFGTKVGKGSSRVAYRVHVEKEQFDNDTSHLPTTPSGKVDTVIKLALNPKGIAQNEQELQTYNDYGDFDILLPILDSSKQHKTKITLMQGEQPIETVSNWIQMPYVEQLKSPVQFDRLFTKYFGDWIGFFNDHNRKTGEKYNFKLLESFLFRDKVSMLQELDVDNYHIKEDQYDNISALLDLAHDGLELGDLGRLANWGIYKGHPVILDYGFDKKSTTGLYQGATQASAYVDKNGNIRLDIRQTPKRNSW